MRRKLVRQGPASHTISLPAEWVRVNALKPGEEVLVTVHDNKVIVSTEQNNTEDNSIIHANVSNLGDTMIGLLLVAYHKKGIDEVRLIITKEQINYIENKIVKHLLGYEIVHHQNNTIHIKFVTKVDAEELPVLFRRTFLVTLSLAEAVVNDEDVRNIIMLEETNNRLTNYCERIINKNALQEKDATFRYLMVWLLEKIADEYKDIVLEQPIDKEDAQVCHEALKQFYDLYFKYSIEKHEAFLKQTKKQYETLMKKNSPFSQILRTLQKTHGSLIALNC